MDYILEKKQTESGHWLVRVIINEDMASFFQYETEPTEEDILVSRQNFIDGMNYKPELPGGIV